MKHVEMRLHLSIFEERSADFADWSGFQNPRRLSGKRFVYRFFIRRSTRKPGIPISRRANDVGSGTAWGT